MSQSNASILPDYADNGGGGGGSGVSSLNSLQGGILILTLTPLN